MNEESIDTGRLSSAVSALSASSRAIPFSADFHYYHNFDEFKSPIEEMTRQSEAMLQSIGSSAITAVAFPHDFDDGYDWLVKVNADVLERVDEAVDQAKKKSEEADDDEGFQLVNNKKKKTMSSNSSKARVSFHVASIRKPQEEFNILANNSNQPFEHVWLERTDDGQRFVHPLEKLSVLDFIDNDVGEDAAVRPPEIEVTPFKLVEEVRDLKELAAKLRGVNEFALIWSTTNIDHSKD